MDSTLMNLLMQNLGDWLILPMQFFTALSYEQFYLFFIPVLYWCINPRIGAWLGIGLMISASANGILKILFHNPRPYWVDPNVQAYSTESSFGAPSGHAQNGIVVWGFLANSIRRRAFWVIAIMIIILIGASRIYLGVHFMGDVMLGWVVGGILLWAMIRFEGPFLRWFKRQETAKQLMITFGISLGMIVAAEVARFSVREWSLPAEWITLSVKYQAHNPINPLNSGDPISSATTLFGMVSGIILLSKKGWLNPSGSLLQRITRSLVGLVGAFLIWYGLKQVLPQGDGWIPDIFRYLRYGLLGLWSTYLAPLIFFRYKLASPENSPIGDQPSQ